MLLSTLLLILSPSGPMSPGPTEPARERSIQEPEDAQAPVSEHQKMFDTFELAIAGGRAMIRLERWEETVDFVREPQELADACLEMLELSEDDRVLFEFYADLLVSIRFAGENARGAHARVAALRERLAVMTKRKVPLLGLVESTVGNFLLACEFRGARDYWAVLEEQFEESGRALRPGFATRLDKLAHAQDRLESESAQGDVESSRSALDTILQLMDELELDLPHRRHLVVRRLALEEKWEEVLELVQAGLDEDCHESCSWELDLGRGLAQRGLGQPLDAEFSFMQSLKQAPSREAGTRILQEGLLPLYVAQNRYEEALGLCTTALEALPQDHPRRPRIEAFERVSAEAVKG